ncbi:hypothetical protein LTR70_010660 [Exophiala xenobiotica]|uniref:FHA domain-containing protein n=1 Tax=Lithohypha guttulata TaxID=1690604 RepID=A0ABR0JV62_9EURO|nr:hypothetical protein LTR24_010602 [Lithohypha guttulata]KAK5309030.1 hypothetical protein LTR70_010660 [Exophiala xenobiotica]
MWILESNGDFLQGKRMWLKPGKKYLFGRVKKDGVRFAIDHKTVSRKHFIITIDDVKDEDVGRVHARTSITITDENSKAGTNIDGELIKNKSQELKNAVTSIRPGSCPHELLIKWLPCTLTFGLQKKEIKSGALKNRQERVKELDIKAISDYLSTDTTHLVAQKRNTPKGLQALIEGKPIISDAYIDALVYASTPTDLQEEENLSPLEIDFDDAWPDPARYLPPAGKEPTDKPAEAYKPDPARAKVFEKHTFFFFDQTQYDVLLPPVTTGHGKALLFKANQEKTTLEEGLAYVRKTIGAHGRAIVIKLNETNDMQPWLVEYIEDLGAKLGQEPANQSDLLDTILANDASQLRKPRRHPPPNKRPPVSSTNRSPRSQASQVNGANGAPTQASANGTTAQEISPKASPAPILPSRSQFAHHESSVNDNVNTQHSSLEDDNPRPRKRTRFVPTKTALDPFDDDFDPDAIVYDEEPSAIETQHGTQGSARLQFDEDDVSVKEEPTPRASRNKSPTTAEFADSDDDLDELLPAGAAMRKEKQRQELEARRKGLPVKSAMTQAKPAGNAKPKKEVKMLNVREAVRARREAEDEAEEKERRELDDLQAEDEGMSGPANLVQVVEYQLPVREKTSNGTNGYRGETWKPEWNGRKNFKGFRRARDVANGTASGGERRPRDKIIVPLVAVKKDTYGLGDQYWEKTEEDRDRAAREKERKKRASQRSSQSQKQSSKQSQKSSTVNEGSDSDNEDIVQADEEDIEHVNPGTTRLQQEAADVLDHPVDVDEPRQTRGGDTQTQSTRRSTATESRSTKGTKRPASTTPSGRATAAKKQKTLPVTVVHGSDSDDQDDDSDDMKFKFGRGRKARAAKS